MDNLTSPPGSLFRLRSADARLNSEVQAHREALNAFVLDAEKVPPDLWNAPRPGDKWSPAQITEHLRLSYVAASGELAGKGGLRMRTRRWQQWFLRPLYLTPILRKGRFPKTVPTIREIKPESSPFDREELLAAFREEGESFLRAVVEAPSTSRISHPFLGYLNRPDAVRFLAQHIRHHHAQIVPKRS